MQSLRDTRKGVSSLVRTELSADCDCCKATAVHTGPAPGHVVALFLLEDKGHWVHRAPQPTCRSCSLSFASVLFQSSMRLVVSVSTQDSRIQRWWLPCMYVQGLSTSCIECRPQFCPLLSAFPLPALASCACVFGGDRTHANAHKHAHPTIYTMQIRRREAQHRRVRAVRAVQE